MTLANQITLLRIVLVPLISIILLSPCLPYNNYIAAALFLFAALSDYLDGYLARSKGHVTDLGKVFDPLADKLLVISVLICLVQLGAVPAAPVITIVFRDLLVEGVRTVASFRGMIIAASAAGKLKTVIQDIAVLMLMLSMPYGMTVLWTAVVISVISGVEYIYKARNLLNDRH